MASSTDSGGGHSPELKKAFLTKMLSSESLYDAVTSVQEVTALLRYALKNPSTYIQQTSSGNFLLNNLRLD